MPEISVIVPVYKVEPYLKRCVDSLLAQTFTDFELILVDDGSPDNCGAICDEYAQKDERVRVIHQKNAGVSSARNAGIDAATGQYIMFCDSDDFVSPYWCETLIEQIRKAPEAWIYSDRPVVRDDCHCTFEEMDNGSVMIKDYYHAYEAGLSPYIWNKIYSAAILKGHAIYFENAVQISEDVLFNLEYLKHCTACLFVPQKLYAYVQREGSAMKKYNPDMFAIHLAPFYKRIPFIGEENVTDYCDKWLYYFIHLFSNVFDQRNPDSWIKKMAYNQRMLSSKEFQFCLDHASREKENPIAIKLLKTRCYLLYWLFEKAVSIRHRKDKVR